MFGDDIAFLGEHVPRSVGPGFQIDDAIEAVDFGAGQGRALGVGLRHAPGIKMAFDRIEHRADEMFLVDERIYPRRFIDRDDLEIHPEIPAARTRHLQPVQTFLRARQIEAARHMHAAGDAGDRLDLLVEIDRVLLQLGDIGIAVERVHAARGMPRRARSQLRALEQHDVFPAALREMIGDAGADDAPADDDDPCMRPHEGSLRWEGVRCVRAARGCAGMKTSTAANATRSSAARQENAVESEKTLAMAPVASGAASRGKPPKKATAEIAAPAETRGCEAASANPQGTIAAVPTPTIAKPTTLVAKPRWTATSPRPAAATRKESSIIVRSAACDRSASALTLKVAWHAKKNAAPSPAKTAHCGASRRSSSADQEIVALSQVMETPIVSPSTTSERDRMRARMGMGPPTLSPASGSIASATRTAAAARVASAIIPNAQGAALVASTLPRIAPIAPPAEAPPCSRAKIGVPKRRSIRAPSAFIVASSMPASTP